MARVCSARLLVAALCLTLTGTASATVPLAAGNTLPASAARPSGGTLTVTPEVAEPGQRLKVVGRLDSRAKRPVKLQLDSGAGWATEARKKSHRSGRFRFRVEAPVDVESVDVRVLAPRYRIDGRRLRKTRTPVRTVTVLRVDPEPTGTPTPTPTTTPTPTPTSSPSPTPSSSPSPSATGTTSSSPSPTVTTSSSPTTSPTVTVTPDPTPTAEPLPEPAEGTAQPDSAVTVSTGAYSLTVPAGTVDAPAPIVVRPLRNYGDYSGRAAEFEVGSDWRGAGRSVRITMPLDPDLEILGAGEGFVPAVLHFDRPGHFVILTGEDLDVDRAAGTVTFETQSLSPFVSTTLPNTFVAERSLDSARWLLDTYGKLSGSRVADPHCGPEVAERHRETSGTFFDPQQGAGNEAIALYCVEELEPRLDGTDQALWRVVNNSAVALDLSFLGLTGARFVGYHLPGNTMLDMAYAEDAVGSPAIERRLAPGAGVDISVPAGFLVTLESETNVSDTVLAFGLKSVGEVIDAALEVVPAVRLAQIFTETYLDLDSCIYGPATSGATASTVAGCLRAAVATVQGRVGDAIERTDADRFTKLKVVTKVAKAALKVLLLADSAAAAFDLAVQPAYTRADLRYTPGPRITTTTLPSATLASAYDAVLETSDDREGTWSVIGDLPPGVELDGDRLTGVPKKSGTYPIRVRFEDQKGDTDGKNLQISVGTDGVTNLIAGRAATSSSDTAVGVANVRVVAFQGGEEAAATTTDGGGYYLLTDVPEGEYDVCFDAEAALDEYADQCYLGVAWDGESAGLDTAVPVTSSDTGVTEGIDALLSAAGSISGRVVDQDGEPIRGVRVFVDGQSSHWTTTDNDGEYLAYGVQPGYHTVCFAGSGAEGLPTTGAQDVCYQDTVWNELASPAERNGLLSGADRVLVLAETETEDIDAQMLAAGAIRGTVVDGAGAPVEGAIVQVRVDQRRLLGTAVTHEDGTFRVIGLAAFEQVSVCAYGPTSPADGAPYGLGTACVGAGPIELASVVSDVDLALVPGGALSGTITSPGGLGVERAEVWAFGPRVQHFATTDDDGTYLIPGLAPGEYDVCIRTHARVRGDSDDPVQGPSFGLVPECHADQRWYLRPGTHRMPMPGSQSVTVSASELTTLDEELEATGSVRGTVQGHDGSPLTGVTVEARRNGWAIGYGYSDGLGGYDLVNVPDDIDEICFVPHAGPYSRWDAGYHVVTSEDGLGYRTQCLDDVPIEPATLLDDVDVTLLAGGALHGTVSLPEDATSVRVVVFDADGATVAIVRARDGEFEVQGLESGAHRVCASGEAADGRDLLASCLGGETWPTDRRPAGDTVAVRAGEVSQVELTLAASAVVTGRVVDAEGAGVHGAVVSLLGRNATTTPSGAYELVVPDATSEICVSTTKTRSSRTGYAGRCLEITTTLGAVTELDIALESWTFASIGGVVTDTGRSALTDVKVWLRRTNGPAQQIYTDREGAWSASRLRPGAYTLCFDTSSAIAGSSGFGYLAECHEDLPWTNGSSLPSEATLEVADGAEVELETRLAIAGRIAGAATLDGTGVGEVGVYLYADGGALLAATTTGADGRYRFDSVADRSHHVCFEPSQIPLEIAPLGVAGQCAGGDRWSPGQEPAGDDVRGVPGDTVTVDAALEELGGLQGTVTSAADGTPIGAISVQVFRDGTKLTSSMTTSDGRWSVTRLLPGDYQVCFAPSPGQGGSYRAECFDDVAWNEGAVPGAASVVQVVGGSATTVAAALSPHTVLEGRVVGAGGAGLADVQVSVLNVDVFRGTSTTTGDDGRFRFDDLDPGRYEVCFYPEITDETPTEVSECWNDKPYVVSHPQDLDRVVLVAGEHRTLPDVQLADAGSLVGSVRSGTGEAIQGVEVSVYRASDKQYWGAAWTDGAGEYELDGLPTGATLICFRPPASSDFLAECRDDLLWDGGAPAAGSDPVTVSKGQTSTVDAVLGTGGSVTGRVTDTAGSPLRGVSATLFTAQGGWVKTTRTDTDGFYELAGLATGEYRVCFSADGLLRDDDPALGYVSECWRDSTWLPGTEGPTGRTIAASPVTALTDVDATLDDGFRFTGTVTDGEGSEVQAVYVTLFDGGGQAIDGGYAGGDFATYPVPAGDYRVCFNGNSGWTAEDSANLDRRTGFERMCLPGASWSGQSAPAGAEPVALNGSTAQLDVVLRRQAALGGRLVDASSGDTLTGWVRIFERGAAEPVREDWVDAARGFWISGLAPGEYVVCATAQDVAEGTSTRVYDPTCFDSAAWTEGEGPPNDAEMIALSVGDTRSIDVQLTSRLVDYARVVGVVTDAQGAPLRGVDVYVQSVGNSPEWQNRWDQTGADGSYEVTGLRPGQVSVCFHGQNASGGSSQVGYRRQCFDDRSGNWDDPADPVTLVIGDSVQIDASLEPDTVITGRVTDEAGDPIPGAFVSAEVDRHSMGTSTSSDGTYRIDNLPAGNATVCAQTPLNAQPGHAAGGYRVECYDDVPWTTGWERPAGATTVAVQPGVKLPAIDFVLTEGAAMSGALTDLEGLPLRGGVVSVFRQNGNEVPTLARTSTSGGTWSARGLPDGRYTVCIDSHNVEPMEGAAPAFGYARACVPGRPGTSDPSELVEVSKGQVTTGIDIELAPAGAIAGTVSGPSGPVGGVQVRVMDQAGDYIGWERTAPDGTYLVQRLEPGDYTVCFDSYEVDLISECYDDAGGEESATPVTVVAEQVTDSVDADMALGGSVTGRVVDAEGAPVQSVLVEARPADGSRALKSAWTDADGSYALRGFVGEVVVCVQGHYEGFLSECEDDVAWDPNRDAAPTGRARDVTPGSAATVDFQLDRGGSISGRLTMSIGDPVFDALIMVFDGSGADVGYGWSDPQGNYTIGGLRDGDYSVCFLAAAGEHYEPKECWDDQPWSGDEGPEGDVVAIRDRAPVTGIDAELDLSPNP